MAGRFVLALILVTVAMAATVQAGSSALLPGAAAALRGVHGSRAPILRTCASLSKLQRLRGGAEEEEKEEEEDLFADDDAAEAKTPKVHPGAAAAAAAAEEKAKNKPAAKTNVVLDVKGWDDETDLEAMEKGVRAIEMDGLFWGASGLEEVGYGIKKLRITCVVEDDKVSLDELEEKIRELEDYVQNVDIAAMQKI